MAKKLTALHPLMKKYKEVEGLMEELGISFGWDGYHMVITDTKNKVQAYLKDNESGAYETDIPTFSEYKLVIE